MRKRFAVRRATAPKPLPTMAAVARVPAKPAATDDEVREEAYRRWETAGRPPGDGVEYWLAAERDVRGGG